MKSVVNEVDRQRGRQEFDKTAKSRSAPARHWSSPTTTRQPAPQSNAIPLDRQTIGIDYFGFFPRPCRLRTSSTRNSTIRRINVIGIGLESGNWTEPLAHT